MAWKGVVIMAAWAAASCPQVAEAIRLVPEPANPRLSQLVTISVRDVRYPFICFWFRGNSFDKNRMIFQVEVGRVVRTGGGFTGRESLGQDCALVIQNLQPSDNGEFYLIVLDGRQSETQNWTDALVQLRVSRHPFLSYKPARVCRGGPSRSPTAFTD